MNNAKITRRIAALLALAASPAATDAERTNAHTRAADIAARFGLDIATIKPGGVVEDAPVNETFDVSNRAVWRASLGWQIARYTGVQMVRYTGTRRWCLVGHKADLELFRALYARAEPEIDAEGTRYAKGRGRSEGDTFRKGAAYGFGERLAQYKAEAEASEQGRVNVAALGPQGGSTALVLVSRTAAVEAKKRDLFPRLTSAKTALGGSREALREGTAFGRSMGVHRGSLS
jgi:hypothetical protein